MRVALWVRRRRNQGTGRREGLSAMAGRKSEMRTALRIFSPKRFTPLRLGPSSRFSARPRSLAER